MSFTRANPSGWSTGAKMTSAQANAIDINISKAVDKSAAGDSISGAIVFLTGSSLTVNAGSALSVSGPTSLNGTVSVAGAVDLAPGVDFNVESGAFVNLESGAEIRFESGSTVQFDSGSQVTGTVEIVSGAALQVDAGAQLLCEGNATFTNPVTLEGAVTVTDTLAIQTGASQSVESGASLVVGVGATFALNAPLGASAGTAFDFSEALVPLTTLAGTTTLTSAQYNCPWLTVTASGALTGDCTLLFPATNGVFFVEVESIIANASGHSFAVGSGGLALDIVIGGAFMKTGSAQSIAIVKVNGTVVKLG